MPLVTLREVLGAAAAGGYAVGAFNCNNMEVLQAIAAAAEAERSPVIVQFSPGAIRYAGLEYLAAMARAALRQVTVPVVLHLDHGTSYEQVIQCLVAGFSSVMIDASHLPLEENLALTKEVVKAARAVGASVEAELGRVGGVEDEIAVAEREAFFTDPDEAAHFVEQTGVDALAVAIGTAHGRYRGEPRLDFERLSHIAAQVKVPLVLHGASGLATEAVREAIERGIRKVNIDTDIRQAFVGRLRRELLDHPDELDPRRPLGAAREEATEVIRAKLRLCGSSGKAIGV
ncbi:class II fructose-1,6-bisphosphate aldolase [Desulfothermobacter acidiphilus]|uniref:class II fructose-1,6-bisphosphate aldolase n=1 Tax=Desulfothermobacter acidiphilus TaxID=1938353 RepID=UPI003F8BCB06